MHPFEIGYLECGREKERSKKIELVIPPCLVWFWRFDLHFGAGTTIVRSSAFPFAFPFSFRFDPEREKGERGMITIGLVRRWGRVEAREAQTATSLYLCSPTHLLVSD